MNTTMEAGIRNAIYKSMGADKFVDRMTLKQMEFLLEKNIADPDMNSEILRECDRQFCNKQYSWDAFIETIQHWYIHVAAASKFYNQIEHHAVNIDGLRFKAWSNANPEQYGVYDCDRQVGYVRMRRGRFSVECTDCGGDHVLVVNGIEKDGDMYEMNTLDDSEVWSDILDKKFQVNFDSEQRKDFLCRAAAAIKLWMSENDRIATEAFEKISRDTLKLYSKDRTVFLNVRNVRDVHPLCMEINRQQMIDIHLRTGGAFNLHVYKDAIMISPIDSLEVHPKIDIQLTVNSRFDESNILGWSIKEEDEEFYNNYEDKNDE